jgi:putative ABC transport system substrate-binding protein
LSTQPSTIPIVFVQIGDPVAAGFVHSLERPGGNVTGFQAFEPAMGGKWLGVLKEAVPNLSRAAVLSGSDSGPVVAYLRTVETIAPSLGVAVNRVNTLLYGRTYFAGISRASWPSACSLRLR